MLVPVRCFTCHGFVEQLEYARLLAEGRAPLAAFEALGVHRYCCRRMLLCNPPALADLLTPNSANDIVDERSDSKLALQMRRTRVVDCL
jgi:DNA-directed RNA polymerase subunit N (RpoN/RPB10)